MSFDKRKEEKMRKKKSKITYEQFKRIRSETTNKQVAGIALSIKRARGLLTKCPEIAKEWEEGKTLEQLGRKYCQRDSINVARGAVYKALKIFLPKRKLKRISRLHIAAGRKEGGKIWGKGSFENKLGIWAPKNKDILDNARKKGGKIGGRKTGKKNYRAGLGLANLTLRQNQNNGKKAARARGHVPYRYEEVMLIMTLKQRGLSWKDIKKLVNKAFGNRRTVGGLKSKYRGYRKYLRAKQRQHRHAA